jgi:hypothetical protein
LGEDDETPGRDTDEPEEASDLFTDFKENAPEAVHGFVDYHDSIVVYSQWSVYVS